MYLQAMQFVWPLLVLVSWSRTIAPTPICVPGHSGFPTTIKQDQPDPGVTLFVNCTQPTGPTVDVQVEPSVQTIISWDNTTDERVSFGYVCDGNASLNYTTTLPTRQPWQFRPRQGNSPQQLAFGDECTFYGCYWYTFEAQIIRVNGVLTRIPKKVVGVTLNSTTCIIDADECTDGTALCEHMCTDTIGSYACTCMDGYQLDKDGHHCNDIDECATGLHNCEHTCANNTEGGFVCTCNDGYVLNEDEHTCDDLNECELYTSGTLCEHYCLNVMGGYECLCFEGYQLADDGYRYSCVDIDECADNETCQQICNNTVGSYNCSCQEGYRIDDLYNCTDIDECKENLAECGDHATCHNTDGGHSCVCDDGYVGNGHNCIHLLTWILPVTVTVCLVTVLCCALVLWRKHKRDKYNNDRQFKFLFKNQFKMEEVDPTYSPVSLLPPEVSYAFPALTSLETYPPSVYSSLQDLEFDVTVKCNTKQQGQCSNYYSLELFGTASQERSESNDNQNASSQGDKSCCHGVTPDVPKENVPSTTSNQLQSNSATADRHENAMHQLMNERNVLLTSSVPGVPCPRSGYVSEDGDNMLRMMTSPAQDRWKMTNLVSENYQSTSASELLPNAGHNDSNGNNQSLTLDPQPTAKHSPPSEPLCDSGIPLSMSGSHLHLALPSYDTTDSSSSLSDHASSGYSSSSGCTVASSAADTSGLLLSTNVNTYDFPDVVCQGTERGEDTQTSITKPLYSTIPPEVDFGNQTRGMSSDSNGNNSLHKSVPIYMTSTVKLCPKTGTPAPSPEKCHQTVTPSEVIQQEVLPE